MKYEARLENGTAEFTVLDDTVLLPFFIYVSYSSSGRSFYYTRVFSFQGISAPISLSVKTTNENEIDFQLVPCDDMKILQEGEGYSHYIHCATVKCIFLQYIINISEWNSHIIFFMLLQYMAVVVLFC